MSRLAMLPHARFHQRPCTSTRSILIERVFDLPAAGGSCSKFLYVFKAALSGPHAPPPGRVSDHSLGRSRPATQHARRLARTAETLGAAEDDSAESG
ncbi:hypothetical protein GCM10023176_26620 [Micromonospora coerulea]|uniref:Uncharacterized protein n=1 Tax=Micromonospora coerulea TaxID=47856 RepID=A0ABP8SKP3_9ACTN